MQVAMCDVCLASGKLVRAKTKIGFKSPHMKLDVCGVHKNWRPGAVRGMSDVITDTAEAIELWDEEASKIENKAFRFLEGRTF